MICTYLSDLVFYFLSAIMLKRLKSQWTLLFDLVVAVMNFSRFWTRRSTELPTITFSILFSSPYLFFTYIGGCWCLECLLNKSKQKANLVRMSDLVSQRCNFESSLNFVMRMLMYQKSLHHIHILSNFFCIIYSIGIDLHIWLLMRFLYIHTDQFLKIYSLNMLLQLSENICKTSTVQLPLIKLSCISN